MSPFVFVGGIIVRAEEQFYIYHIPKIQQSEVASLAGKQEC